MRPGSVRYGGAGRTPKGVEAERKRTRHNHAMNRADPLYAEAERHRDSIRHVSKTLAKYAERGVV